jgi:hypothetical protein
MVNNNLVPVDFLVMDVECKASCPIILGRPFLQTVGAIIDMREGTIKYQFPLKKGVGTPAYHLGFPLCIQFTIPGRSS